MQESKEGRERKFKGQNPNRYVTRPYYYFNKFQIIEKVVKKYKRVNLLVHKAFWGESSLVSVMPDKINYNNNSIHCTTEMLMQLMLL